MACSKDMMAQGKPYPRTCYECGLGPCIADRAPMPAATPTLTFGQKAELRRALEQRIRAELQDYANISGDRLESLEVGFINGAIVDFKHHCFVAGVHLEVGGPKD